MYIVCLQKHVNMFVCMSVTKLFSYSYCEKTYGKIKSARKYWRRHRQKHKKCNERSNKKREKIKLNLKILH